MNRQNIHTPADIPSNATLSDLEAVKKRWLKLAEESHILEDCAMLCTTLGAPVDTMDAPHFRSAKVFSCAVGDIHLFSIAKAGRYLPALADFEVISTLYITTGRPYLIFQAGEFLDVIAKREYDKLLAQYEWSNSAAHKPRHQLYLPGEWVDILAPYIQRAKKANHDNAQNIYEHRRRELLAELLAGEAI